MISRTRAPHASCSQRGHHRQPQDATLRRVCRRFYFCSPLERGCGAPSRPSPLWNSDARPSCWLFFRNCYSHHEPERGTLRCLVNEVSRCRCEGPEATEKSPTQKCARPIRSVRPFGPLRSRRRPNPGRLHLRLSHRSRICNAANRMDKHLECRDAGSKEIWNPPDCTWRAALTLISSFMA